MVTALGDSKTSANEWRVTLASILGPVACQSRLLTDIAAGGTTVSYWAANIATSLASYSGTPTFVLLNLGVNDVGTTMPAEATWKANLATILDALHAKWANAQVGVAHAWRRGYTTECATLNGWGDAVRADGRTAWTFAGPDEAVWLEGGDDGATMTTDGVHYSAAGQIENAAQWKAAMGY